MSPDGHEDDHAFMLLKERTVVSGNVDASPTGKDLVYRMIVEQRVERFTRKEIFAFHESPTNCERKFTEFLKKLPMKSDFHIPCYRERR